MNTRALARELFPKWSRRQRARWVVARLRARRCAPTYAGLMPVTIEQYVAQVRPWGNELQFAPRTRREAGFVTGVRP